MLFGIDYARDLMRKKREKEAQAYQGGYNAADTKCRQRQNGNTFAILDNATYWQGYDDGFNASRAFTINRCQEEAAEKNG